MKEYRVKPSSATVTSIDVSGRVHHYAHTKRLGKIRAILIPEDENLPIPYQLTDKGKKAVTKLEKSHRQMVEETIDEFEQEQAVTLSKSPASTSPSVTLSKGDKLAKLMDCNDRLSLRYAEFWTKYQSARDIESGNYWLKKATLVLRAITRLGRKIVAVTEGN